MLHYPLEERLVGISLFVSQRQDCSALRGDSHAQRGSVVVAHVQSLVMVRQISHSRISMSCTENRRGKNQVADLVIITQACNRSKFSMVRGPSAARHVTDRIHTYYAMLWRLSLITFKFWISMHVVYVLTLIPTGGDLCFLRGVALSEGTGPCGQHAIAESGSSIELPKRFRSTYTFFTEYLHTSLPVLHSRIQSSDLFFLHASEEHRCIS